MVGNATVDGVFYSVTDGKRLALNPYALTYKRQILSTPVPIRTFGFGLLDGGLVSVGWSNQAFNQSSGQLEILLSFCEADD